MESQSRIQVTHPLVSLVLGACNQKINTSIKNTTAQTEPEEHSEVGRGLLNTQTIFPPPSSTETQGWDEHPHTKSCPQLTGTSKASWVSSSIWILMDMSFPEDMGGGFCPCSNVLIPEFSGAPSLDPGVGLCSISPMMKADYRQYLPEAEREERYIRRKDAPRPLQ